MQILLCKEAALAAQEQTDWSDPAGGWSGSRYSKLNAPWEGSSKGCCAGYVWNPLLQLLCISTELQALKLAVDRVPFWGSCSRRYTLIN